MSVFSRVEDLIESPVEIEGVVKAGIYDYDVVGPGQNDTIQTSGGVHLKPRPSINGLHAEAFGVVDDITKDSGPQLQTFFHALERNEYSQAYLVGKFGTRQGLRLGMEIGERERVKTESIKGLHEIKALSPDIENLLEINNMFYGDWDDLWLRGYGGTPFANRKTVCGLKAHDIGQSMFRRVRAYNFACCGIHIDSEQRGNNNYMRFQEVQPIDCGSGHMWGASHRTMSLRANWSEREDLGSTGSTGQSTKIKVDTPLPDYILNESFGEFGETPYLVQILHEGEERDGDLHYVMAADKESITVYPWIDMEKESGRLVYIFGGGMVFNGADTNVCGIDKLDATRCGIGFASAALYGSRVGVVSSHVCGINLAIGRSPSGASLGGNYGNIYSEATQYHVAIIQRNGHAGYNMLNGEYAMDFSKVVSVGAPRSDRTNELAPFQQALHRTTLFAKGKIYQYEKPGQNFAGSQQRIEVQRPDQFYTLKASGKTMKLICMPLDMDLNRLFGYDSVRVVVLGNGLGHQLQGDLTFEPPKGWTVNGISIFVVEPSTDEKLRTWMVYYNIAKQDVSVFQV